MGILDEAIREHLELKRQHGAEESELQGLESQAFGPSDRPDAVEAETQIISPGSSITVPAGEGDQLDKVFEATRQADATAEHETSEATAETPSAEVTEEADSDSMPSASTAEVAPPEADAPAEPVVASPPADAPDTGEPVQSGAAIPKEQRPSIDSAPSTEAYDDHDGGDAGDALQRERDHLSDHPTEHYDVDAAIAEENEIDILSESSLSDELDRALDGPSEPAPAPAPAGPAESAAPAKADILEEGDEDPISDEFEHVFDDEPESAETELEPEPEAEAEADLAEPEVEEAEAEESEPDAEPVEGDADFFDQDDPLEATPDFLEETPEHDRMWFEQKPPKDFEFGD